MAQKFVIYDPVQKANREVEMTPEELQLYMKKAEDILKKIKKESPEVSE